MIVSSFIFSLKKNALTQGSIMHFSSARLILGKPKGKAVGKAALEHRRTGSFDKISYVYKAMPVSFGFLSLPCQWEIKSPHPKSKQVELDKY